MTDAEMTDFLVEFLLDELPRYRPPADELGGGDRRRLLRSLMNLRPPAPLDERFLAVQNALLSSERDARGVVDGARLPSVELDERISLWRGDITRLKADAIVNAANSALLGCFVPCHGCIDNAIHSAAGLQLRGECDRIMRAQGFPEPSGRAKLTCGYNLPAKHVLHTVGPIVRSGRPTARDAETLANCYRSCLELAAESGLESVAFCCISTGEFGYPNRAAAEVAVASVRGFLKTNSSIRRVIFNVFKPVDEQIYRELLGKDRAAETRA